MYFNCYLTTSDVSGFLILSKTFFLVLFIFRMEISVTFFWYCVESERSREVGLHKVALDFWYNQPELRYFDRLKIKDLD